MVPSGPLGHRPEGPFTMRQRITHTAGTFRATSLLASLALASCGSDTGDTATAASTGAPLTTYVGYTRIDPNPGGLFPTPEFASVLVGNEDFTSSFGIVNEADGGLALDYFGNAYQADIRFGEGALLVSWSLAKRSFATDTGVGTVSYDRTISGFNTTLIEPRNVAIAHVAGLVMVTDTSDSLIKVWGTSAGGDVPPLFTADPGAEPWDVAFDDASDTLFAALTNGTIAVFDDFTAARPTVATRTIIPSLDGAVQASVSLRGIAIDPSSAGDRLVATDFGVADSGVDGALWEISGAAAANGPTLADRASGGSTGLRGPVDVVIAEDGFLRVADGEGNRLSVFAPSIFSASEPRPTLVRALDRPAGIALEPEMPLRSVGPVSDVDDPSIALDGLIVTTSPAGGNGSVLLLDESLGQIAERVFSLGVPAAAVAVDALGDAYVGTTDGFTGGIGVVNRFTTQRGEGFDLSFDSSRDRLIQIAPGIFFPVPTIVDPQGLDVDSATDLVVISDPGFPGIWVFGRTAGDSAAEVRFFDEGFTVPSILPQGLDYDAPTDRLFVAVSNGTIYVYDAFTQSPGGLPDRVITPANALGTTQASTSIRDVLYDSERDILFATELGAASGVGDDGAIYVIPGASSATGLAAPLSVITGALTGLDDPYDLAWNGATLWVTDTANETISRFDDALTLDGNAAPDASVGEPDVRSIAVVPAGLAPATGGSIYGE